MLTTAYYQISSELFTERVYGAPGSVPSVVIAHNWVDLALPEALRIVRCWETRSNYTLRYVLSAAPYPVGYPRALSIYEVYDDNLTLNVYKLQDEWYYLSLLTQQRTEFYQCDQESGLIECLQSLKV